MFARKTILAASLLAGLGIAPAFAQSTSTTPPAGGTMIPAKPAAPTMPTKPTMPTATPATTMPATMAAGQFSTEAEAKAHCPSDTVVWGNLNSKVYHLAGTPKYGKTKRGAYMCMADATAGGFRKAGTRHAAAAKKPS